MIPSDQQQFYRLAGKVRIIFKTERTLNSLYAKQFLFVLGVVEVTKLKHKIAKNMHRFSGESNRSKDDYQQHHQQLNELSFHLIIR